MCAGLFSQNGYIVCALKDFEVGDAVSVLDGVWIDEKTAIREKDKRQIHAIMHNFNLDTTHVLIPDNPMVAITERFEEQYYNLQAEIFDINESCDDLLPKILFRAVKPNAKHDELYFPKGKIHWTKLSNFESITLKEQQECRKFYDIKLTDFQPAAKTWNSIKHRPMVHETAIVDNQEKHSPSVKKKNVQPRSTYSSNGRLLKPMGVLNKK